MMFFPVNLIPGKDATDEEVLKWHKKKCREFAKLRELLWARKKKAPTCPDRKR